VESTRKEHDLYSSDTTSTMSPDSLSSSSEVGERGEEEASIGSRREGREVGNALGNTSEENGIVKDKLLVGGAGRDQDEWLEGMVTKVWKGGWVGWSVMACQLSTL
jgi:hypothetical protein